MLPLKIFFQLLGLYGVGISLALGWLLAKLMPTWLSRAPKKYFYFLSLAGFIFSGICSVAYLFYPNFIDHVEPTVLHIAQIWVHGGDIYPPLSTPSMHGLLYGPLLYWIQAPFVLMGGDIVFNAKLPGILAFNAAWILLFWTYKNSLSRSYLVFLLPFNLILFWNRAEPFFVLFVAIGIWLLEHPTRHRVLFLGALAGLASSCKLHGFLYVLPLLLFLQGLNWRDVLVFICTASVVVSGFFVDSGTSLPNYLEYLQLASRHGISATYLGKNLFFLACIWVPLVLTLRHASISKVDSLKWLCILGIEIVVSIVGAKPGAGVHHLIPIVVLNSYLYEIQLRRCGEDLLDFLSIRLAFAVLSIYILFFAWKNVYESEIKGANSRDAQAKAVLEIQNLSYEFPNLFMGVTDKESDSYRLTFFRAYLFNPRVSQFEYAGFMDLNYSGVSSEFLLDDIAQCKHPFVVLPIRGEPFSIVNFYTNELLFSEVTQKAFRLHYQKVKSGEYFSVYKCLGSS